MGKRDQALSALRQYIDETRKDGHTRLPPERSLCLELGIPRGTLRQAFSVLEAEGKIWRHVGRGTFLGSRPPATDGQLDLLTKGTNPEEVMEVRIMIEPKIAAYASRRASTDDLTAMQEALSKSEAAPNFETFEYWDSTLHQTIAKAARNALLNAVFDSVNMIRWKTEWGNLKASVLTQERRKLYEQQHREIVAAIAERDAAKSEQIMCAHLEMVKRDLFGSQTSH